MDTFKTILFRIFRVIDVAVIIWFLVSYIDILAHNLEIGYNFPDWNFFIFFFYKFPNFF